MALSEAGSDGGREQSIISISVSHSKCRLKGVGGHPLRREVVALLGGDNIVRFCDGSWIIEGFSGTEAARPAITQGKTAIIRRIMLDER